jgi:hypothetical protein
VVFSFLCSVEKMMLTSVGSMPVSARRSASLLVRHPCILGLLPSSSVDDEQEESHPRPERSAAMPAMCVLVSVV